MGQGSDWPGPGPAAGAEHSTGGPRRAEAATEAAGSPAWLSYVPTDPTPPTVSGAGRAGAARGRLGSCPTFVTPVCAEGAY